MRIAPKTDHNNFAFELFANPQAFLNCKLIIRTEHMIHARFVDRDIIGSYFDLGFSVGDVIDTDNDVHGVSYAKELLLLWLEYRESAEEIQDTRALPDQARVWNESRAVIPRCFPISHSEHRTGVQKNL